ncbi:unnamed protein product [Ectocarpus sp. 4 AP-2014]
MYSSHDQSVGMRVCRSTSPPPRAPHHPSSRRLHLFELRASHCFQPRWTGHVLSVTRSLAAPACRGFRLFHLNCAAVCQPLLVSSGKSSWLVSYGWIRKDSCGGTGG